jgi:hypothetical protein
MVIDTLGLPYPRPTVAAQQCGDIVGTLDAIELVAKNCMGQAGMKTIYDLVQYAKSRITATP